MVRKTLVLGASGFLGSHVTRRLVARGHDVHVFVRASSNTSAIDSLSVTKHIGHLWDADKLAGAMQGCSWVFHCVVDTRAWLYDPAPLYRTNVQGLLRVLDAALEARPERFIYTSTYATIGRNASGISDENDAFSWKGTPPAYVQTRVDAENRFFGYCRERGLPGVACCVGNTYGEADVQPTPHGKLLRDVATGRMPFYWEGGGPTLNIRDAAEGMVLAAERGRIGERYILGGPYVSFGDLFAMAARAADRKPPRVKIPLSLLYVGARVADAVAKPLKIENKFSVASLDCSACLPKVSSQKAIEELGWDPGAPEQAVREAVAWYLRDFTLP